MGFKTKTVKIYSGAVQTIKHGGILSFGEEVEAVALFQVLCISILCFHPGLLQAISIMVTHFLLR